MLETNWNTVDRRWTLTGFRVDPLSAYFRLHIFVEREKIKIKTRAADRTV